MFLSRLAATVWCRRCAEWAVVNLLDPRLTNQVFAKLREMREHKRAEAFVGFSEQELHILAAETKAL
jgi:hypothetical protein